MTRELVPPRVLFVSHTFPPQGGGGSRRVAQLVTLLARAGCRVAALTRSLPEALARRAGLAFDAEPLARLQAEHEDCELMEVFRLALRAHDAVGQ